MSRLSRRGVALPLALFSLVILAVMITAVFYVGRLEQRMGDNSLAAAKAFEAAEAGITQIMNGWQSGLFDGVGVGGVMTFPDSAVGTNAVYTATVRRINTRLYLVQSEGKFVVDGHPVTRRQLAQLARLEPVRIRTAGVVTSLMPLEVGGTAIISGRDTVPPAWGAVCPPPAVFIPAIGDSTGILTFTGSCGGGSCLDGNPDHSTEPTFVTTSNFTNFGTATWASLAGTAEKVVGSAPIYPAPNIGVGSPPPCVVSDLNNWGDPLDPTGPCGQYLPLVYAPGDLNLAGGRGQGILMIEGNFTMSPGALFYGLVLVHGTVALNGGTIVGGLMVHNPTASPAVIGGNTRMTWSECVVDKVRSGLGLPRPLSERPWVQLY